MEATLIRQPEFKVDFRQFHPKVVEQREVGVIERSTMIAQGIIRFVGVLFISVMQGAYLTLCHVYSSFSRLILDTFKITDFYFGAFKIGYWAFTLGFTFVSTTSRFILDAYVSSKELYLSQFMHRGMNPTHIQTKETKLDASSVPASIKVEDLLTHFDEINFRDPTSPFYMNLGNQTPDKLREGLKQFVDRVNNREAFLGTPPAHDTVRLENFYQQIQDAVRLSLDKLETDLKTFRETNPGVDATQDPAIKKRYRDLLEDRARMIIDLAIAGHYCGARYMGDAMEAYFHICGEGEISGTLQETIFQILAEKRLKIAKAQIQTHYGTDTHAFSKYMQNMGALLAIPGTENIIEHLSQSFNVEEAMQRFFAEYTEECIIEAIQEKLHHSQHFRELVIDWLKNQRGQWVPALETTDEQLIMDMQTVLRREVEIPLELTNKMKIIGEVFSIDPGVEDYPRDEQGWDEFIDMLFVLPQARAVIASHLPESSTVMDGMRFKNELMSLLKFGSASEIFRKKFQEEKKLEVLTDAQLTSLEKIRGMRQVLPMDESVLSRILSRDTELEGAIKSYRALEADAQFLSAINLGNLNEQGLYPLLMEWILDAHEVFYPQSITPQARPIAVEKSKGGIFLEVIDTNGYAVQLRRADQVTLQSVLPFFESEFESTSPRYLFGAETDIDRVCNQIFENAFNTKADAVIAITYAATGKRAYSMLRREILIDATSNWAKVMNYPLLKIALSVYIVYKLIQYGRIAYEKTSTLADQAHRYLKKEAHPTVQEGYRIAAMTQLWIQSNKWQIFLYAWIFQRVLMTIPHSFPQSLANRIAPSSVLGGGGSYLGIMISLGWDAISFGWNVLDRTSSALQALSNRENKERLALEKQHAYAVWKALGC